MKTLQLTRLTLFFILCYFPPCLVNAQVGIGTITPHESSILDIRDPSGSKGLLIPQVALTATNVSAPVTPFPATSLLVYNTATSGSGATRVLPGYYYWNGSRWIVMTNPEKWDLLGNAGTDQSVNFVGTTDANALTFRTNNIDRLRIANGNQVLAMKDGNSDNPFYSWNSDKNLGIYRAGANILGFSTNKLERMSIGLGEILINKLRENYDFRIKSRDVENMFVVKGATNRIGIKTDNPQTELHIAGNSSTLRIEELNKINNIYNVEADPAPVYVDNNGDLTLQPPLTQVFMPVNEINFLGNGVVLSSRYGDGVTRSLYTRSITLTQESLICVNYQLSVQITNYDNGPIVDGGSRLFRSYISIDDSLDYIGVATGNYTNYSTAGTGGTYASGYFYLSGTGYIKLAAGTHSINLSSLGFGGDFGYKIIIGESDIERFQVVVQR